jgi:hypothetical protein
MTYLTIDDRPASPNVLLVDSSNWAVLAVLTVPSNVPTSPYVNPNITYQEFVEVLMFLETQRVTKNIVLTGSTVLAVLPLISEAYTNSEVASTMHFTLVASVQGFNGNANVNKVTFKDTALQKLDPSIFANADTLTLTIAV